MLYQYTNKIGGKYKTVDNNITEIRSDGTQQIRFQPLACVLVSSKMDELCQTFNANFNNPKINQLILILNFVFDFLCIHPFLDGNGRISRLSTHLLLYKSNHFYYKFLQIDKFIFKTQQQYYDALLKSSLDWHDNQHDPLPFIYYMLTIILQNYQFIDEYYKKAKIKNPSIVQLQRYFDKHPKKDTYKNNLIELFPGLSLHTIKFNLMQLLKQNYIIKKGKGRNTFYQKNLLMKKI
ncbi:hypothetical protein AshY1_00660 [Candidatus Phytoplasma fraxini]|uniref:Fido domain-containing protein n=2 Tax=Ash yellows phytoplasma TaxID=35780 RepID=A0ABZ2U993_ASHYP